MKLRAACDSCVNVTDIAQISGNITYLYSKGAKFILCPEHQ
jgi:hypothetical protein